MFKVTIKSPVFECEVCDNKIKLVPCEYCSSYTGCQNCGGSGENIWGEECDCNEHIFSGSK